MTDSQPRLLDYNAGRVNSDFVDSHEEGGTSVRDESERLPVSKLDDPDMQAAPAAMERAVRRAKRGAHRHGTGVLVVVNGKMVEPDPALYEDDPAAKPRN